MKNFARHLQPVILLLLAICCCTANYFVMPNGAMEPTIKTGERIQANLSAYKSRSPARWDVVVFQPPHKAERIWAFRVVGLPGETVAFRDGAVVVNGRPLAPPSHLKSIRYAALPGGSVEHPYPVPEGEYYVLGDNSARANDSRMWGGVPRENIIGKALCGPDLAQEVRKPGSGGG